MEASQGHWECAQLKWAWQPRPFLGSSPTSHQGTQPLLSCASCWHREPCARLGKVLAKSGLPPESNSSKKCLCNAHEHHSPHRHCHAGPLRVAELASGEPAPLELLWQPCVCSPHSAQDLTPSQHSTLLLCLGGAALTPLLSLQDRDVAFPEVRGQSETLTIV